jgi:hypothetical protein
MSSAVAVSVNKEVIFMSVEIIREGHKPDTKLYFTCKCGCIWKADEKDCEERTIELQRDQTFKRYYYKCPTCGHNVMGRTREEYIAIEAINREYGGLKLLNSKDVGKSMKKIEDEFYKQMDKIVFNEDADK